MRGNSLLLSIKLCQVAIIKHDKRTERIESRSKQKFVYGNLVYDKGYFRPLVDYSVNRITITSKPFERKIKLDLYFTSHGKINFN